MQFISVRDLRAKGRQLWKDLEREGELLVTLNGKPIALLTAVNEKNFDQTLGDLRRARALRAVDEMQRASVQAGLNELTDEEIDAEIQKARSLRRR